MQGHLSDRKVQTHRLKTRPLKAVVAIAHTMLTVIWHMAQTGALYDDPGPDFFTRLHPERTTRRAIDQLRNMGYTSRSALSKTPPSRGIFESVSVPLMERSSVSAGH